MSGAVLLIGWIGVNYFLAAIMTYHAERSIGVSRDDARIVAASWPKRLFVDRMA